MSITPRHCYLINRATAVLAGVTTRISKLPSIRFQTDCSATDFDYVSVDGTEILIIRFDARTGKRFMVTPR